MESEYDLEELADLLEVVEALAHELGSSLLKLWNSRKKEKNEVVLPKATGWNGLRTS